jgi:hypothetical protein
MIKFKNYFLKKEVVLTGEVLSTYVLQFWNEVFAPIIQNNKVKHLMVLCKVKYSEDEGVAEDQVNYKTLGRLGFKIE